MSNQTKPLLYQQPNQRPDQQSRRHFLKGTAYTSALSGVAMLGLSNVAFSDSGNKSGMVSATSSITLFNQSDRTIALDASQPVSLEKVNGWVVVKINKASEQSIINLKIDEIITLSTGQTLAFTVDSELAPMLKESGDSIVITNEYSALNNMVPISIYDALVA